MQKTNLHFCILYSHVLRPLCNAYAQLTLIFPVTDAALYFRDAGMTEILDF